MSSSPEGRFGYGIYLNSADSYVDYYLQFKKIIQFFEIEELMYCGEIELADEQIEDNPLFVEKLKSVGLRLSRQYSYEARAYCLIVESSRVASYEDPEVITINHIIDRSNSGYETMDKLAEYLGKKADFMVWGFYG